MAVNIFFRGRERYVRVFCDQMAPQELSGEVPQNRPFGDGHPPDPPILTSFAMSNFAMLDSWLS